MSQWLKRMGFAVAVAGLVIGSAGPALAMSATVAANPTSYNGACPATIAFTGTIFGPASAPTTYYFGYFDPGQSKTIKVPGTSTIGPSGFVSVTASGSMTGTGTGNVTLFVTAPGGGTTSNTVQIAVNCTGTTSPPPSACKYCQLTQPSTVLRLSTIVLHPTIWKERTYEYKWVGVDLTLPESGLCVACDPGPTVGWYHHKTGDSFWLYHQNDFIRSFLAFDQNQIKGLHVSKATLTLKETGGWHVCFGALGHATTWGWTFDAPGTIFNAPYPVDGDFSMSVTQMIGGTGASFDVTPIVQAWANGSLNDLGFVMRGTTENNGSDGNDSCKVTYSPDAVLTINQ